MPVAQAGTILRRPERRVRLRARRGLNRERAAVDEGGSNMPGDVAHQVKAGLRRTPSDGERLKSTSRPAGMAASTLALSSSRAAEKVIIAVES